MTKITNEWFFESLPDTVFADVYAQSSAQERAVIKLCLSRLHALHGSGFLPYAQTTVTEWKQGFVHYTDTHPYDWVYFVCADSFNFPQQFLAALMPALCAQVPYIACIGIAAEEQTCFSHNFLVALELAGVENVFTATCTAPHEQPCAYPDKYPYRNPSFLQSLALNVQSELGQQMQEGAGAVVLLGKHEEMFVQKVHQYCIDTNAGFSLLSADKSAYVLGSAQFFAKIQQVYPCISCIHVLSQQVDKFLQREQIPTRIASKNVFVDALFYEEDQWKQDSLDFARYYTIPRVFSAENAGCWAEPAISVASFAQKNIAIV